MRPGFKIYALTLIACLCISLPTDAKAKGNLTAVFSLRPTNFEAMGYNSDILYALLAAMERYESIDILPRRKMEDLLSQNGLAQSDNLGQVQKAGDAMKVSYVVFGSVTKAGAMISANLHLLDVPKQKVVSSWSPTFASPEAIKKDIPGLASNIEAAITQKRAAERTPSGKPVQQNIHIENLSVQAQPKQVVVAWQPPSSSPVAGFNVYRASRPEGPYQFQGRTAASTFADSQVCAGRQYYYRIGLITPNGSEVVSPLTADIKFTGQKVPHPPLIMSATGHIRRARIEFVPSLQNMQDKFKITAYEVYRRSPDASVWQPIKRVDAGKKSQLNFSFEDCQITADGITYLYALKSIDHKDRESALCEPVTVNIPHPPELKVEKDNLLRRIDFTWQPLSTAQGYNLYRKTDTTDWRLIGSVKGAEHAHYTDDRDLADDAVYHYYLTAFDGAAETDPSNIVQAHTKHRPPKPTHLSAASGLVKAVKITWDPIDDPDIGGYIIYRGIDPDQLSPIAKIKGYQSSSYMDKGKFLPSLGALLTKGQLFSVLEDGRTYFYSVSGFNLYDGEGDRSPTVSATTKPRPSPVSTLTASGEQRRILLRWEKSAAADVAAYKIFRSGNGSDWSEIETVDASQSVYRDSDLKPELKYRYRVIAEDQDGLKSDPVESDAIISPVPKSGT